MLEPKMNSNQDSNASVSTGTSELQNSLSSESPRYGKRKRFLKHLPKRPNSTYTRKSVIKSDLLPEKTSVLNSIRSNVNVNEIKMEYKEFFKQRPDIFQGTQIDKSIDLKGNQDKEQFGLLNKRKRSLSYPGETSRSVNQNCFSYLVSSFSVSSKCLTESCDFHELDSGETDACNDNLNIQSSDCNANNATTISPSIETISASRRSSTSTVRERNNSIDSAISQMSIIDISEFEDSCYTNSNINLDPNSSVWHPQHSRSKSDVSYSSNPIEVEECSDVSFSSLPSSYSENTDSRKKSIFEGSQMIVATECFFPTPQQGQSLTSFLSSNEFNIRAELDKENAHFCIAEAMIAAIERIKCTKTATKLVQDEDESDEEIRDLTQRIRIRRRERQREKSMKNYVFWNDGRPDTGTSQSASPPVSSHSSDFEVDSIGSEDEIEDMELSDRTESNLSSMKENGLSLSMASLYSDADLQKMSSSNKDIVNRRCQDPDASNVTAESVALALLRRFSEKQLPKASDLEWLVSEKEANGQRLLPLPDSWPISPDTVEEEFCTEKIRLRGNLEWAPPRPQIIFIIHPQVKRKIVIEKQKYQCAGCGMKIEHSYISRFRYCNYFGKYFCQCCHSNDQAYIPGHILWKWDFTKYHVSKLAYNLLDQMYGDPLFSIIDINANQYKKVRQLEQCRMYRMQLFYLKDFIRTCRKADDIQSKIQQYSSHIFCEPHMYSLSDLVQVRSGELAKILGQLVNLCMIHVKRCGLCQAKGFICEICGKESDVIFPFQLDKVALCESCGSCFHKRCYKAGVCPRCVRIQKRKKSAQDEINILNEREICV